MDEEQIENMFERLRANTSSLSRILTSLLDTAQLDRGLVQLDADAVPVAPLLEGCAGRLATLFTEHTLVVDVEPATIAGDGDLLERVVDNLLTNAQRHTPAGTEVRVTATSDATSCTIAVTDNGPGIQPGDLTRLTERFTRGGDHHTRPTRGLGLGLALAEQVLRLHGTRLDISSTFGEGARFAFTLPLASSLDAGASNEEAVSPGRPG